MQPFLTPGEPLPRWQMQASWARALGRLGHEVRVVKYTPDDRIRLGWGERIAWNLRVVRGVWEVGEADLIIYSLGADVLLPQTLNLLKAGLPRPAKGEPRNDWVKLVVLSGVSPIKDGNPRERAMASLVDLAATNDESHAREWLELGAKRAVVLPIAGIDPELHHPRFSDDPRRHFFDTLGSESSLTSSLPLGQKENKALSGSSSMISKMASSDHLFDERVRDIDVVFVGTLTQERRRFFDKLRQLLPKTVKMVIKEFVWEEEYAELMSRAKIGVNLLRPEMERGVNLRAFEIPAFGAMEITSFCRKEWLVPGKEVEVFGSAKEAAELIKKYLKNDRARERMAAAGQERVMREHMFDERAERLMETVKEIK